jgi:hypothetical protein
MRKDLFQKLPKWLQSNVFYRAQIAADSADDQGFNKVLTEVHPLDANLISSEKANGKHILMLDLDQDNFVSASTTTGHSHVYIDADLSLDDLQEIVDVLAKHGILQSGIKKQVETGKCLTFRPPGVKKGVYEDEVDVKEYKKLKDFYTNPKDEIALAFGLPSPISLPKEAVEKIEGFKNYLKGKNQKWFDAEYASKKGFANLTVPGEHMVQFIQAALLKLGLDYQAAELEIGGPPSNFYSYKEGNIKYKNKKIANVYHTMQSNEYMIQFKKEYFVGPMEISAMPKDWPTWEQVVKVMSEF